MGAGLVRGIGHAGTGARVFGEVISWAGEPRAQGKALRGSRKEKANGCWAFLRWVWLPAGAKGPIGFKSNGPELGLFLGLC